MKVQAKIITEQECKWYGVALQDEEVVEIRVAAWFLTEKFCGIKNRQYDFEGVKAKKSGILGSNANAGSGSRFFLKSKAQAAIDTLLKMRNTEWENRYKENGIKFETRVNI